VQHSTFVDCSGFRSLLVTTALHLALRGELYSKSVSIVTLARAIVLWNQRDWSTVHQL